MNLLSPGWLWALFALLPLTLIYLLKVRPTRKPTNAYFLWTSILEEKTASALFRRFRDLFSWLFLLLATIFIVVALTKPRLQTKDLRDLVIIVDQSPSMGAGEVSRTTLDLAKQEAEAIVQSLDGSRRAAIAGLSDQLRFTSHLSDSPRDLLEAVQQLSLSPLGTSTPAVEQTNRLSNRENVRVILLTDGHAGFASLSPNVEVLTLDGPTDNVGLVAADLAWIPGQPNTARLFFRTASSFASEKDAELIFRNQSDGTILRILPLTLQPGLNPSQSLTISGITPGSWSAILEVADSLSTDNTVTFGLTEPRRVSIDVDSEQPYFFQRSIQAFEQVGSLLQQVSSGGEISLTDKADCDNNRLILFHPHTLDSPWWQNLGEEIEVLAPEFLIPDHPILRHLEVESLSFTGARQLTAPPNSVVLVESQNHVPLIYKANDPSGRQAVVFNFDPSRKDFVLSPWFPVLIYEGSRHLTGEKDQLASVYPLGSKVSFPAPELSKVTWKKPSGKIIASNEGHLLQPGLHRVTGQGRERLFGASLLNSSETLLDHSGPTARQTPLARGRLLSWWLLLLALTLVVAESILYHRRKLG